MGLSKKSVFGALYSNQTGLNRGASIGNLSKRSIPPVSIGIKRPTRSPGPRPRDRKPSANRAASTLRSPNVHELVSPASLSQTTASRSSSERSSRQLKTMLVVPRHTIGSRRYQPNSTLHDGGREVAISMADLVYPIIISVPQGMRLLDSSHARRIDPNSYDSLGSGMTVR